VAASAKGPNTTYVGDFTYLPLDHGLNRYLATVIDCCSRKLAGWAVADHMRTELITDALKPALAERGSLRGAMYGAGERMSWEEHMPRIPSSPE